MLNISNLHKYQKDNVERIINNPFIGLFLDMGLGKTITTLTALNSILLLEGGKVLIIAPLKVAQVTWSDELENWSYLQGLSVSKILGDAKKRIKAVEAEADLHIINRENVDWLVANYPKFPFSIVVIDELSSFKNSGSKRFKALKKVRPYLKRVIGLTGTPAPNGLIDLWAQMFLIDQGERLGRFKTKFLNMYFKPTQIVNNIAVKYEIVSKAHEQHLLEKISDICISMKARDYLDLPDTITIDKKVYLTDKQKEMYNELKKESLLPLQNGEIVALNAASLTMKLLQISNGAVYDADREVHHIHDEKIEVMKEVVEELQGENLLVFYNFIFDKDRILKAFPYARVLEAEQDQRDWNEGKIQMLLAHPQSAGHGLNLQKGGHNILWFGAIINLEYYQQANARLDRQGQTKPVKIIRLVTQGIETKWFRALKDKEVNQDTVMELLKSELN